MSRAFVKEDANPDPEPRYGLPDPDSAYFNEAAARALIEGATKDINIQRIDQDVAPCSACARQDGVKGINRKRVERLSSRRLG